MSFFWRIFLSLSALAVISVSVAIWAASRKLPPAQGELSYRIPDQMTRLIANELQRQLAIDPDGAVARLARDQTLDFPPFLTLYILNAYDEDVLARPVPDAVREAVTHSHTDTQVRVSISNHQRISVATAGLHGNAVVGVEGFLPLREVVRRPGGRTLLAVLTIAGMLLVSFLLSRFIVLPVRRLQLAEQKVAAGDLSVRVAHTLAGRTDEIAHLARDFDHMTERVETLVESQKRMLRDVSHELRTPLARLQALLSIARQSSGAPGAGQIDRMETELERLNDLIGEILSLSRLESRTAITRHPTDIVELVQNIINDAGIEGQAELKRTKLYAPERLIMFVDSGLIERAIENVIRNALKYTAHATTVEVRILQEDTVVRVVVDDEGPGIPETAKEAIFEPFFRVSDARSTQEGSGGIGLAIADRSIRLHGGAICASNRESGGLRIEIVLPLRH